MRERKGWICRSGQIVFIPRQVNNFPPDLRNPARSLGPIRESSLLGPTPGRVSIFSTGDRERESERERERERERKDPSGKRVRERKGEREISEWR